MINGVMIAPIDVPLCSTPLPSERSRASSNARVASNRTANGRLKKPEQRAAEQQFVVGPDETGRESPTDQSSTTSG